MKKLIAINSKLEGHKSKVKGQRSKLSRLLTFYLSVATIMLCVGGVPAQTTYKLKRMPRGLTDAEIKTHVIAPDDLRDVEIDEYEEPPTRLLKVPKTGNTTKRDAVPKFDIVKFAENLHSTINPQVAGYILQVRQNGNVIYGTTWSYAQTPSNMNLGWNADIKMHVASVSKYLTAVGLVKLLDSKNISYDAKIKNYLPASWSKGANIDKITFRHLLTHNSGFDGSKSASDFNHMKSRVAAGVKAAYQAKEDEICIGRYKYQNMNFGLMRILIPIIRGDVDKNMTAQNYVWDAITIGFYKEYMQDKVFEPAGVTGADFKPVNVSGNVIGGALAYKFPPLNSSGWNSGNLQTVAGGAGWRLSIKQLLDVMNHVRRKNTIISATKAQTMLDSAFGIDRIIGTDAGNIYNKNGRWRKNDKTEQCVAYFLPDNMEMAIFVNSPISTENFRLRDIVSDTLVNSLSH